MRFFTTITLTIAAQGALGSWFSKAAYNKWHETELERWLADHDIPYPTPYDRKQLQDLVQENWGRAVSPFQGWETDELGAWLKAKGVETQSQAGESKDQLVSQVKSSWYESEDKAQEAWTSVKDWILDTWTESQLKAFCDKHGIPVPQPRKRDTLLQNARANYETVAQKAGDMASYPGNWLYETWSESDLKEWLDTNGFPAPQPTNRDRLVASVRRNSRLAYLKMQDTAASATASAQKAYATLTDMIIDTWSETQLKEFCDKNGIPVPQGTKLNELQALVRKHRAKIMGDDVAGQYGAATSRAGNEYAKATDSASMMAQEAFDQAVGTWSDSRLKAYLDARGVSVPQASKTDELRALVRRNSHLASNRWNSMDFSDYSLENLRDYVVNNGDAAAKAVGAKSAATRDELVSAANSAYSSASSAGGSQFASVTSYLSKATATANKNMFDTWSESELKAYLDSYGVPVPQGSKLNELRAEARKQWTYWKYGTKSPSGTLLAKMQEGATGAWNWVANQFNMGADEAKKAAADVKSKAKEEL
jgi:hypothetical protein